MIAIAGNDQEQESNEWKEVCRKAETMAMAGDGEHPERALKGMILELLGGLKALRSQTGQIINRTVAAAAKKRTQEGQKLSQPTWAAVASQNPPPQKTAIKVYISDQQEQKEIEGLSGKEIIQKIGIQGIIGARKEKGGVLKLFTAQEQDRKRLETQKEWTVKLGKTAKVSHQQNMVIAHGMTTKFDIEGDLKRLQDQNQAVCPGLQITKAAWVNRKTKDTKRESSLVLWIGTVEQANTVLDKGIFWECERMDTEIHRSTHRLLQCFKCQQYGHISTRCPSQKDTCSHCAGSHKVQNCTAPKSEARCACCGKKHPSWSQDCTARIEAKRRAREARINTPIRFQTGTITQEPLRTVYNPLKRGRTEETTQAQGHPAMGRPKSIVVAGRDPSQSRLNLTTIPNSSQQQEAREDQQETSMDES